MRIRMMSFIEWEVMIRDEGEGDLLFCNCERSRAILGGTHMSKNKHPHIGVAGGGGWGRGCAISVFVTSAPELLVEMRMTSFAVRGESEGVRV